jgi:hypothetical protein
LPHPAAPIPLIDRNSLWDEVSIGLRELCVNKNFVAICGQGLSGQKTTSCDEYYRKKTADYVSKAREVI